MQSGLSHIKTESFSMKQVQYFQKSTKKWYVGLYTLYVTIYGLTSSKIMYQLFKMFPSKYFSVLINVFN